MKLRQVSVVLASVLFAGTVAAGTGSPGEQRGYENCARKAGAGDRAFEADSTYYVHAQDGSRMVYLNGRSVRNGAWMAVRVACETSLSGHRVLAHRVEAGQYRGRLANAVAQN